MQPYTYFIGTLIPTSFSLSMIYNHLSLFNGSLITGVFAYGIGHCLWKAKIKVKREWGRKKRLEATEAYYKEFDPQAYEAYYGEKHKKDREIVEKNFVIFEEDSWS